MSDHTPLDGRGWLAPAATIALRLLLIGAAVYAVVVILIRLRVVVLPLLLALLLAALLSPAVRWLEGKGLRALPAAGLVMIGFLALVAGMIAVATVLVTGQIDDLQTAIVDGWDQIQEAMSDSPVDVPDGDIGSLLARAGEQMSAAGLLSGIFKALEVAAGSILTLFFTFFLVKDGASLFERFTSQFHGRGRDRVEGLGIRIWQVLSGYVRGLTAVALFNALLKGLALVLIGIPLVVPLMLITFVGSYIPFAGPIVAGLVAALVALAEGGLSDALLIVAAAIVIQQIEGNVFQPLVYGRALDLHPIVVVGSVTGGAVLAGISGALLAVPLVAIGTETFIYFRDEDAEGRAETPM